MKRFLLLALCCVYGTCFAQNNFIAKWEQQALLKRTSWKIYTDGAKTATNHTYTSLYVNGHYVASFSDAGICYSKIDELKRLAQQIYNQNSTTSSKKNSSGINYNSQLAKLAAAYGINSDKKLDNALTNAKNAADAKRKEEQLAKVENSCTCKTEQNPNYKSSNPLNKENEMNSPQTIETGTISIFSTSSTTTSTPQKNPVESLVIPTESQNNDDILAYI
jgi:hypothetical protein